jgi:undecaprenyl-diphosphatase
VLDSLVLGAIQGVTEWLPVSSEGAVTAAGSFFFDLAVEDAIAFALWLHLGTAIAAGIAFRSEIACILREALRDPTRPSPLLKFLVLGTAGSVIVGLPILLALDDISGAFGAGAMVAVGVAMLFTGAAQARRPAVGKRNRFELSTVDALMTGVAQGFAAVPGLSRSGLTVAVLLGRGVDRAEALAASFLLSIPAALGAALFAALDSNELYTKDGIIGAVVAMVIGLASIKVLMAVAARVNFAGFVLLAGLAIIGGGIAQFWI